MIIDRFVFSAKLGRQGDLIKLLKADMERHPLLHATRIFWMPIGPPRGMVVVEHEFKDRAESEKFWGEWGANPEAADFLKELRDMLTEAGWRVEQWVLVD
jgi:hypothetical protein